MRKRTALLSASAIAIALAAAPLTAPNADPAIAVPTAAVATAVPAPVSYNLTAIEAAMKADSFAYDKMTSPSGNVLYQMQIAGLKFVLVGYGIEGTTARSMQLQAGFDGGKESRAQKVDAVNKWNFERRYAKAYVTDEDDVVLEMDFVPVGAIEPKAVADTISGLWMRSLISFATRSY
jgi:hypothetical protein